MLSDEIKRETEHVNGSGPAATPAEQPAPAPPTPEAQQLALEGYLASSFHALVRGHLVTSPGVPPEMMLLGICAMMGTLMGHILIGEEGNVLRFRKRAREIFKERMMAVPPVPLPTPPAKADTAVKA